MGARGTMNTQSQTLISRSVDETQEIAARLARELQPGTIIALHGQLGSGKTAFVRGLVQGMGGEAADVSSPTFVIVQSYDTARGDFIHMDAYRVRCDHDLETIGWDELIASKRGVLVVEWAERIATHLPKDFIAVTMEHIVGEPAQRRITISRSKPQSPMMTCPICRTSAPADNPFGPFCSHRCKRADLGRWLSGRYTISRPLSERDIESQD